MQCDVHGALLDVSVTNVALRSIGDDMGAGSSQLQWTGVFAGRVTGRPSAPASPSSTAARSMSQTDEALRLRLDSITEAQLRRAA